MAKKEKRGFFNSRIRVLAQSRTSFFTSNLSLFFLLTLLIHASGILIIANLPNRQDEITMAKLEIAAVELNLSESVEESAPSPPPTPPPKPEPEKVPEEIKDPEMTPPEITPPAPEFKPVTIPTPDSVVLPESKPEPPEMTPPEPEPLRIEAPRLEPPPLPPLPYPPEENHQKERAAVKPPEPETPPSDTPESGAASAMIDQPPKPRRTIKPRYPSGARRRGEEGSVTLDVSISTSGRTRSVRIAESSGFAELDEAAKQAVKKARFTPGKNKGKSVKSQARLTIIFKLK